MRGIFSNSPVSSDVKPSFADKTLAYKDLLELLFTPGFYLHLVYNSSTGFMEHAMTLNVALMQVDLNQYVSR